MDNKKQQVKQKCLIAFGGSSFAFLPLFFPLPSSLHSCVDTANISISLHFLSPE
jgi:hypothetical protein